MELLSLKVGNRIQSNEMVNMLSNKIEILKSLIFHWKNPKHLINKQLLIRVKYRFKSKSYNVNQVTVWVKGWKNTISY